MKSLIYVLIGMLAVLAIAIAKPGALDFVLQSRFLGEVTLPRYNDGSEKLNRNVEPADLAGLYPEFVIREWKPATLAVALTFDDAPDAKYTPRILDILAKYKVRATFFLIGRSTEEHPEVVKRIIDEGHAIGNHTYFHSNLSRMVPWQVVMDLDKAADTFSRIVGQRPMTMRPPYGALDPLAVEAIGKRGYKVVLWTIDSLDWRGLKREEVLNNVIPKVKSGVILLHHAATGPGEELAGMVEALPEIIENLQSRGFVFSTVPEVIEEIERMRNKKK